MNENGAPTSGQHLARVVGWSLPSVVLLFFIVLKLAVWLRGGIVEWDPAWQNWITIVGYSEDVTFYVPVGRTQPAPLGTPITTLLHIGGVELATMGGVAGRTFILSVPYWVGGGLAAACLLALYWRTEGARAASRDARRGFPVAELEDRTRH